MSRTAVSILVRGSQLLAVAAMLALPASTGLAEWFKYQMDRTGHIVQTAPEPTRASENEITISRDYRNDNVYFGVSNKTDRMFCVLAIGSARNVGFRGNVFAQSEYAESPVVLRPNEQGLQIASTFQLAAAANAPSRSWFADIRLLVFEIPDKFSAKDAWSDSVVDQLRQRCAKEIFWTVKAQELLNELPR